MTTPSLSVWGLLSPSAGLLAVGVGPGLGVASGVGLGLGLGVASGVGLRLGLGVTSGVGLWLGLGLGVGIVTAPKEFTVPALPHSPDDKFKCKAGRTVHPS